MAAGAVLGSILSSVIGSNSGQSQDSDSPMMSNILTKNLGEGSDPAVFLFNSIMRNRNKKEQDKKYREQMDLAERQIGVQESAQRLEQSKYSNEMQRRKDIAAAIYQRM
jgi:hypothetical protein